MTTSDCGVRVRVNSQQWTHFACESIAKTLSGRPCSGRAPAVPPFPIRGQTWSWVTTVASVTGGVQLVAIFSLNYCLSTDEHPLLLFNACLSKFHAFETYMLQLSAQPSHCVYRHGNKPRKTRCLSRWRYATSICNLKKPHNSHKPITISDFSGFIWPGCGRVLCLVPLRTGYASDLRSCGRPAS